MVYSLITYDTCIRYKSILFVHFLKCTRLESKTEHMVYPWTHLVYPLDAHGIPLDAHGIPFDTHGIPFDTYALAHMLNSHTCIRYTFILFVHF